MRVRVGEGPQGATNGGTTQRNAVLDTLGSSGRFRTAQEIYSELRSSGARIGLTTVYRHLQKLADSGTIHAVQTDSRQTAYRLCSTTGHHHHLICVGCGAGVEIIAAEIDGWVESQTARLGYSRVSHSLEIRGLCPACARDKSATGTGRADSAMARRDWDGEKGR